MIHSNGPLANTQSPEASTATTPVLVAEGLRKFYGPREALRGLTFSLQTGRILGFLGPNGAGKTTAIRILTTIMEPSAGHFSVDGISSQHPEQIRRRIGVLPENLGFPKQITGLEYLTFFGQLYGQSRADARAHALTLLEAVGLQQRAKSLIGTFSHGMRQRLGIARALVNDPVVVFLDEPTLGLDPRGQRELLSLVRRIARERNAGVVLCSHALAEIESVCDDVVILSAGQVVAAGSVTEVIGRAQQADVQHNGVRVWVPAASLAAAQQRLEALPHVMETAPVEGMEGWLRIELVDMASPATNGRATNGDAGVDPRLTNQMLGALIDAGIPILAFQTEGGRLQDAFLRLTEEVIR
ncbi:MAG: ABC transporter ATP-binding protein [Chloroflexi bacterium]|nr:MAG: ABC transporter ATP-binding protein [Chloroflexota bacterium]